MDGRSVVREQRIFRAENIDALGHPLVAWDQLREGLYRLSGTRARVVGRMPGSLSDRRSPSCGRDCTRRCR